MKKLLSCRELGCYEDCDYIVTGDVRERYRRAWYQGTWQINHHNTVNVKSLVNRSHEVVYYYTDRRAYLRLLSSKLFN